MCGGLAPSVVVPHCSLDVRLPPAQQQAADIPKRGAVNDQDAGARIGLGRRAGRQAGRAHMEQPPPGAQRQARRQLAERGLLLTFANSEASWNRMVDLPQPPRRLANATLRAGIAARRRWRRRWHGRAGG